MGDDQTIPLSTPRSLSVSGHPSHQLKALRCRLQTHGFRPSVEFLEDRTTPTTLPSGFAETTVASGFSGPTAMEFAPDGRLFVLEQGGKVKLVQNGGTTVPPSCETVRFDGA